MSINRRMKKYAHLAYEEKHSESGASEPDYVYRGEKLGAISKISEALVATSERYKTATHSGLFWAKDITAQDKILAADGREYRVISANTESRLNNLILQEITGGDAGE